MAHAHAYQHFGTFTDGAGRIIVQYDGAVKSAEDHAGAYKAGVRFVLDHGKDYVIISAFPKPIKPEPIDKAIALELFRTAIAAKYALWEALDNLCGAITGEPHSTIAMLDKIEEGVELYAAGAERQTLAELRETVDAESLEIFLEGVGHA